MTNVLEVMRASKLVEIVAGLASYDAELTIYAIRPWTCDSTALVAREPGLGGLPPEAESCGAVYFIEVLLAKELVDDWTSAEARVTSVRERCERLIEYAEDDA